MITIDTETKPIIGNPLISPPAIVGVSIKYDNAPSEYLVGGEMKSALAAAYRSRHDLLFHNAPFDLAVIEQAFGFTPPHWQRIHDTQYLIFLEDPHAPSMQLKPSAARILYWEVDAKDELEEWIMANCPEATSKTWGAFIWKAPADLVGRYARDDTDMTYALWAKLWPQHRGKAYDRERELMPYLVAATRRGVRVDRSGLEQALEQSVEMLSVSNQMIKDFLDAPDLDISKGASLADALDKADMMSNWVLTKKTGKRSTARENLMQGIKSQELLELLIYHGILTTITGTFIKPWLEKVDKNNRLHPNWNQVRSFSDRGKGTRTGRLSSDDPNYQNVPVTAELVVPTGLLPLPSMRDFVLPEEGHVWISRDYSNQEMRLLAEFEEGELFQAFCHNPKLDPHAMVQTLIKEQTGQLLKRKYVKQIGFGLIYGMGVPGVSKQMGVDPAEGAAMVEAYHAALPGVKMLQRLTKYRGRSEQPITTLGGRQYYVEQQVLRPGHVRTFEYKLLNYLIQGSAADQTKQAIIDWHQRVQTESMFTATVHDEINISAPAELKELASVELSNAMEHSSLETMVPMRSTVEYGESWGKVKAPVAIA